MNELVSIIVPVYNVERYLVECVQSILSQTYDKIEILLVDDGSTDKSGEICDALGKSNNKIRVFHKRNGGLSDARNTGIQYAKGTYISFVDSDDYIWSKYVEVLLSAMIESDADIVQGAYVEDHTSFGKNTDKCVSYTEKEAFRDYLLFGKVSVSACAKLYKKTLFENIRFPVGRINEDNLTIYKLLYKSERVVIVPYNIYYYRVNEGTIMHGAYNAKRFEVVSVKQEMNEFLGPDAKTYVDEVNYHSIRILYWVYNEALLQTHHDQFLKQKKMIRQRIIEAGNNNKYLSIRYRLYYSLLKYTPSIYKVMLLIYRRKDARH